MVAKFKKTIATIVAAAWLFTPALISRGSNRPVDYEYLDNNKKVVERVDYQTFRDNLDSCIVKQKIENQDSFVEMIIKEINTQAQLNEDRGYNIRRGVNEEEFSNFIFDKMLKNKLNYDIKTPTDIAVGLNMVLEYLVKYNNKMLLEKRGLGSDVNDDGRFDGVNWAYLEKVDKNLQEEIMKKPEKGVKVAQDESKRVDTTPTDLLLMGAEETESDFSIGGVVLFKFRKTSENKNEQDSVGFVCRNYMSALQVMFDTAKKRYPELTKDMELLQMTMPGHIFGAFINKKTLEYIVVDPTWHDSKEAFDVKTFAWPPLNDQAHYDCLKNEALFQTLKFEKDLHDYWEKFSWEFFSHKVSKKMLKGLVPKIRGLTKKYPNSKEIVELEMMTYMSFAEHKDYSKAYTLLKELYDNKEKKEKLELHMHCNMLLFLGGLAFEIKDYKQAIYYYQECSKIWLAENSSADEAMLGLAEANFEIGDYYEALFRAKDVLDLLPDHYTDLRKGAEKIVSKASKKIWDGKKRRELTDYINGDYKKAVKNLSGQDAETKLLLAESYASLNDYKNAKSIYTGLVKNSDKTIVNLAQSEMDHMNRKLFVYGYMHFFDYKFKKSIEEFNFLKIQMMPNDKLADKTSLFLIFAYDADKQIVKAVEEVDYFLKNFPNSEYKKGVEEYVQTVVEAQK